MRLDDVGAGLDTCSKGFQQIGRYFAVRIHHHHRISLAVLPALVECPGQRITFPALLGNVAFQHYGTGRARAYGGVIRAIIRNNQNTKTVGRPIESAQTADNAGDHGGFVMRRNNDVKTQSSRRLQRHRGST